MNNKVEITSLILQDEKSQVVKVSMYMVWVSADRNNA